MYTAILAGQGADNPGVDTIDVKELEEPQNPDDVALGCPVYKVEDIKTYDDVHKLYHYAVYPHYMTNTPAVFVIKKPQEFIRTIKKIPDPEPVSCPLTAEKTIRHLQRMPKIKSLENFTVPEYTTEIQVKTKLEKHQHEAASHFLGPALVLAPPGSGKTATIVTRIIMLCRRNVDPSRILCITFTRKAQQEMRSRLIAALGKESGNAVTIKTYHALAYALLTHLNKKRPRIIPDRFNFLVDILETYGSDVKKEDLNNYISLKINNLEPPSSIQPQNEVEFQLAELYAAYINRIEKFGLTDPDNMLLQLYTMLKEKENVRNWLMDYTESNKPNYPRGRWQFILIDEAQDNNLAQDVITRFLTPWDNIYYVADEDQLLYSFRGSNVERILNLNSVYPNLREIYLKKNFRSHPEIVKMSDGIIKNNEKRRQKEILPARNNGGAAVMIKTFKTMLEEIKWVAESIKTLMDSGEKPENIAVMYRVNTQGDAVSVVLTDNDIPHELNQSDTSLFNTTEAEVIINHLRVLADPNDKEALLNCLRLPRRTRNPEMYEDEIELNSHPLDTIRITAADREPDVTVTDFCDKLRTSKLVIKRLPNVGEMINYIRRQFNDIDGQFKSKESNDRFNILEGIAGKFHTVKEFRDWINRIQNAKNNAKDKKNEKVQLLTVHSAKGLEFPVVFLINCTEGHFPHNKSYTKDALEEERRIFYVGVTRAEDVLYMTGYHSEDREISRFLEEASASLREIRGSSENKESESEMAHDTSKGG